jgi:hypothetical protein
MHDLAFFGERELLEQVAAALCFDQRVAVQLGLVLRDKAAFGVVPGAVANAIACVNRRLTGMGLGTQVGAPRAVAAAGGRGQCGAVRVGAGQTAQIPASADAHARHEESHGAGRRLTPALGLRRVHACKREKDGGHDRRCRACHGCLVDRQV